MQMHAYRLDRVILFKLVVMPFENCEDKVSPGIFKYVAEDAALWYGPC